jgi:hypothetical protein
MQRPGLSLLFLSICCVPAQAQTRVSVVAPVAPAAKTATVTVAPAAGRRTFHDPAYKVSFDFPANWTFSRKDGEISTFHLDARSALPATRLRAVAAIPENPFPESTFSGAHVYLSVTPHSTDTSCAMQAVLVPSPTGNAAKPPVSQIAGIAFAHGHDEQRHICTTDRDEVYTTLRKGACYRFDLAMNNFCGGEVSGVKDVTAQQLDEVRRRMEAILATVRFDGK